MLYVNPATILSEYSKVMGILSELNLRQFELSTTADDSNKKALDSSSMILILKKVLANKVTSVVLQKVYKDGFKIELILSTNFVASEAKVSVTIISDS